MLEPVTRLLLTASENVLPLESMSRRTDDLSDLDDLPPEKERKLRDMRPMEIAVAAEGKLVERRMRIDGWLETVSMAASGAPLSRYADLTAQIVRYALRGKGHADDVADHARAILADLISCPAAEVDPESDALERVDPYLSDLATVCCAALGRYRLEVQRKPIPDGWLAALANVTGGTIRAYVSGKRAWAVPLKRPHGEHALVTVSSATKFLAHRAEEKG
jgi:hypothetical protein